MNNLEFTKLEQKQNQTKNTTKGCLKKSPFSFGHHQLGCKLLPNVFCHYCLPRVIYKMLLLWSESVENWEK